MRGYFCKGVVLVGCRFMVLPNRLFHACLIVGSRESLLLLISARWGTVRVGVAAGTVLGRCGILL